MTGGKWINHREHAESESRPPGHEMCYSCTGGRFLLNSGGLYYVYEKTGTGFSFKNYNAHEMLFIIRYAENVFTNNKAAWQNLVRRAMDENFSWDASARQYETLYDKMSDN